METTQTLAHTDRCARRNIGDTQRFGIVVVNELQHHLGTRRPAHRMRRRRIAGRCMGRKCEHYLGQSGPHPELISGRSPVHRLPAGGKGGKGLALPPAVRSQRHTGTARVGQQRLQVVLPEHAARPAAHKPRQKHQIWHHTGPVAQPGYPVGDAAVKEGPLAGAERQLQPGGAELHAPCLHLQKLQFLMPVPGHRPGA